MKEYLKHVIKAGRQEYIQQEESGRSPKLIIRNGQIKEIIVSQTLLGVHSYKGEKNEICWSRFFHESLICDVDQIITPAMLNGLYFESQCIGSSRYGSTNDLPRKLDGGKTVDHIRIDEAVKRFHNSLDKYGIILIPKEDGGYKNVQVTQRKQINYSDFGSIVIWLEGTGDIVPTPLHADPYNFEQACCDLKLTKDRNGGFGKYNWGYPDQIDHTQAVVYGLLFDMPFFYWVFDYNPKDRGEKIVVVNTDVNSKDPRKANEAVLRRKELDRSIRSFCSDILTHEGIWPTNPNYHRCKNCPLFDCKDRTKIEEI